MSRRTKQQYQAAQGWHGVLMDALRGPARSAPPRPRPPRERRERAAPCVWLLLDGDGERAGVTVAHTKSEARAWFKSRRGIPHGGRVVRQDEARR